MSQQAGEFKAWTDSARSRNTNVAAGARGCVAPDSEVPESLMRVSVGLSF
jgi:hypothetical protein